MKSILRFVLFLVVFLLAYPGYAANLSGKWSMDANGWTFNLILYQKGNRITGKMLAINSKNPVSKISGSINRHKITFSRNNRELGFPQKYTGYINTRRGSMSGEFTHNNKCCWGWTASRRKEIID